MKETLIRGRELEVLELIASVRLEDGRVIAPERCDYWQRAYRSWNLARPEAEVCDN